MTKERCECKNLATWCYIPGFSNDDHPYFCDDCVPRGCECNHNYCDVNAYQPPLESSLVPEGKEGVDWKWIEEGICWVDLDGKQREYPCAEYDYDPDGYEREINPHEYEK